MIGRLISESIFSSQSSREKRAEFDDVIRLIQKIWPKNMGLFLCANLSRAWDLIFSINSHTGYMNVNSKSENPYSSHLDTNDHFLQNFSYFIANNRLKNYVR